GTTWRALNFNDSAWRSGPAQLGFGDGDEATPVANNGQITTYFRATFVANGFPNLKGLNVALLRDDGAVVYLNGTEVFRSNMPPGPISSGTVASNALPADE